MVPKNIVLLHGWGVGIEKLFPLRDELVKHSWNVYLPKIPGFDFPSPEVSWGLKDYVMFILRDCRNFFKSEKYFIFGHSFGGRVALKAASFHPKLLSGVVLCSTSGLSRGNLLKRYFFWALAKIGRTLVIIPSVAKVWKIFLYKLSREHDYEKLSGSMKETFRRVVSEDLKPLVPKIKLPVLVFWGKKDKMTPVKDAYYIKNNNLQAKLILYENEGHRLPYSRPNTLAQEIDKWFTEIY